MVTDRIGDYQDIRSSLREIWYFSLCLHSAVVSVNNSSRCCVVKPWFLTVYLTTDYVVSLSIFAYYHVSNEARKLVPYRETSLACIPSFKFENYDISNFGSLFDRIPKFHRNWLGFLIQGWTGGNNLGLMVSDLLTFKQVTKQAQLFQKNVYIAPYSCFYSPSISYIVLGTVFVPSFGGASTNTQTHRIIDRINHQSEVLTFSLGAGLTGASSADLHGLLSCFVVFYRWLDGASR